MKNIISLIKIVASLVLSLITADLLLLVQIKNLAYIPVDTPLCYKLIGGGQLALFIIGCCLMLLNKSMALVCGLAMLLYALLSIFLQMDYEEYYVLFFVISLLSITSEKIIIKLQWEGILKRTFWIPISILMVAATLSYFLICYYPTDPPGVITYH